MKHLAIFGGPPIINPKEACFKWPKITKDVEEIVLDQLHKSISIYNSGGVFGEFEKEFSEYHGGGRSLLFNSGTSALHAMFEALDIQAGDEVICPVYTFFATVTPLLQFGAIPVFVDCDVSGNIQSHKIKSKITPKTKGVIVTHMWGVPCDVMAISKVCKEYGIFLAEDCSHAHGASVNNRKVGTFGDVACWSLQGQKVISGGEGGILLTTKDEIYYRALAFGHYNKRCKEEIPNDHYLSSFSVTGIGLKLRAHPIAIRIAQHQLKCLDSFLYFKRKYANQLFKAVEDYDFLAPPIIKEEYSPSWYAFTMQYSEDISGVKLNSFIKALHAEGLVEFDNPDSTRPLNSLPLFTRTNELLSQKYNTPVHNSTEKFPNAWKFYKQAIKIPVWTGMEDEKIVAAYISGLRKVCDNIKLLPRIINNE